MSATIESVDLMANPGLYRLTSRSPTVYYVAIGDKPSFYRAYGGPPSPPGINDEEWLPLIDFVSWPSGRDAHGNVLSEAEIDWDDYVPWLARVGRRHRFYFYTPGGPFVSDFWWTQSVLERIVVIDDYPAWAEAAVPGLGPRPEDV